MLMKDKECQGLQPSMRPMAIDSMRTTSRPEVASHQMSLLHLAESANVWGLLLRR